eukprot:1926511-Rhodomonas_salina.5
MLLNKTGDNNKPQPLVSISSLLAGISLRACYAMSGTLAGTGAIKLSARWECGIPEDGHEPTRILLHIFIRACYAMPGTDVAYQSTCECGVRVPHYLCYAMSGTDVAYAAISAPITLCACYAMSGTDVAYATTR